jgi:6,7-dimethyl-8-ribityllumazine synthase
LASRAKAHKPSARKFSRKNVTIGIVVAQWHNDITGALLKGALAALKKSGIPSSSVIIKNVPGSFELPLGAQFLRQRDKADAVICLGCIIQGETPHFEFISQAVAQGIMDLNLKYNIPVIFGVLTTNTVKQAKQRSGGKHGNKGADAAIAALEMLELKK